MGIISTLGIHSLAACGREAEDRKEGSGRVHTLLHVMLGKRQRLRPKSGSSDKISSKARGKHSSPGPPASQEGLPGPGFLGFRLGEGQDLGEQAELRKVKKAVSDNSPVFLVPWDDISDFPSFKNLAESSLSG